jgi:hypothetical protein
LQPQSQQDQDVAGFLALPQINRTLPPKKPN